MNAVHTGASAQQRIRALDRAKQIRTSRAELKRRLRVGELAAAEAILRGSRDTDTWTVTALLTSQAGWGPVRVAKVMRSVSLAERKTLGSLTERQRLTLAAVLIRENKRRCVARRADERGATSQPEPNEAFDNLEVEARTHRRTALVELRGELDIATVSQVAEVLNGLPR
jgi:hypothetical protein